MRTQSLLAVSLALALAPAAFAGSHYTVKLTGPEKKPAETFSVVAEDGRVRATTAVPSDDVVVFDGVLALADSPLIALNSTNQTWYELTPPTPFALRSRFLEPIMKGRISKLKADVQPALGGTDGYDRYYGQISYTVSERVSGEMVAVECSASFEIITTSAVSRERWPGRLLPVTSYAAVNGKLVELEQSIAGFPVRMSMTVRRAYVGGAPMTDTHSVDVSAPREAPADPAAFVRPAGYRNQAPVIGTPAK